MCDHVKDPARARKSDRDGVTMSQKEEAAVLVPQAFWRLTRPPITHSRLPKEEETIKPGNEARFCMENYNGFEIYLFFQKFQKKSIYTLSNYLYLYTMIESQISKFFVEKTSKYMPFNLWTGL